MKSDKWLDSDAFSELFDVSIDYISVFAHSNRGTKFVRKVGRNNQINIGELERIRNRRVHIWNKSHENYYEIKLERGLRDSHQIKLLMEYGTKKRSRDSWNGFITYNLFREIHDVNILNTGISPLLIQYYEWSEDYLYEPIVSDFRSVDEYYDYWEARKMKEEMIA